MIFSYGHVITFWKRRAWVVCFIYLSGVACFFSAHAQDQSHPHSLFGQIRSQTQSANGWAVGFESSSYMSWKDHPSQDRYPYGVFVTVDRLYSFRTLDLGVTGQFFNSFNQPLLNYLHLDELNLRIHHIWGADQVVFGRYRMVWSSIDSEWQLGVWQPHFMWNYMRPVEQGLTGVFFQWAPAGPDDLGIDLFMSPFFIPSQGPSYVIREGQFESANPWFSVPINQILIGSGAVNIHYNLDIPNPEAVVINPGLAARIHSSQGPYWWNLAVATKPSNQLAVGLRDGLYLKPIQLDVDIYPRVQYHTVGTMEMGWRPGAHELVFAVLGDWPHPVTWPSDMSSVQDGRNIFYSSSWTYHFRKAKKNKISISYFFRDQQEMRFIGDTTVARALSGSDRYFFHEAIMLLYQGQLLPSLPLGIRFRGAYDFHHKGVLLINDFTCSLGSSAQIFVGLETIGVNDDQVSPHQNPFMQYRLNDRVYGGVSYVF